MYVPLCVWFLQGQGALKKWVCVLYRVLLLEGQGTLRNWGTECVFLWCRVPVGQEHTLDQELNGCPFGVWFRCPGNTYLPSVSRLSNTSGVWSRAAGNTYLPSVSAGTHRDSVSLLWDQTLGPLYRLLTGWVTGCCPRAPQSVRRSVRWGGGRRWGAELPLDTRSALSPIYSRLVSLPSP